MKASNRYVAILKPNKQGSAITKYKPFNYWPQPAPIEIVANHHVFANDYRIVRITRYLDGSTVWKENQDGSDNIT